MSKAREILLLMVVGGPLLILLLAIFGNLQGFESGVSEVVIAVWRGAIILFFVGLILGIAYVVIRLRQMSKFHVVGPTKHGPVQALVVREGRGVQRIEQLQSPMADPRMQLEMLEKIMKVAAASAQSDQRMLAMIAKQQQMDLQIASPQDHQPQEEQIVDSIPAVVRYDDIADEIPSNMSLLGIHPEDGSLELTDWEKLKCLWVVGSSSSGKSNTVFGKAQEARERGAKFAVVDQHATKSDSLARRVKVFESSFLRPIAISDQQVLDTLAWFKGEFERRVACKACASSSDGTPCAQHLQKIVLICDEMNRMNRNEALRKPLQEIVAICGEESRGFGMYGWFISQKCAHLKWLRDSAITVIVHRLTRFEEALLACNDDRAAARRLLLFKIGRTYVYGVDFDELMELQQALYPTPKNDSPSIYPNGEVGRATEELPAASSETDKLVYFTEAQKQREVENESLESQAQKIGLDPGRVARVLQMMMDGKSTNQIMATEWGIAAPGGKYQAALPELREIQKIIARRAFGSAYEAGMN